MIEEFDREVERALLRNECVEDHLRTLAPPNAPRLAPEQAECQHVDTDRNVTVHWSWQHEVFICDECGAPLVIPELMESMGLSVASA